MVETEEKLETIEVVKRNGKKVEFDGTKVAMAIKKGFDSVLLDSEENEKKYNTKDIRIWELYLCACAVAFNVCFLDVNEMIFE